MKKLRLEIEALAVDTFPTSELEDRKGTVHALSTTTDETFECQTFTDCSFAATKQLCCSVIDTCGPPITG